MRLPAILILCLAALAGCVEAPAPGARAPLRIPQTDLERQYLGCVGANPLFRSPDCRRIRAALSDDPYRGISGR